MGLNHIFYRVVFKMIIVHKTADDTKLLADPGLGSSYALGVRSEKSSPKQVFFMSCKIGAKLMLRCEGLDPRQGQIKERGFAPGLAKIAVLFG